MPVAEEIEEEAENLLIVHLLFGPDLAGRQLFGGRETCVGSWCHGSQWHIHMSSCTESSPRP